jgi:U3 small nucleolar RNA-associated protein 10
MSNSHASDVIILIHFCEVFWRDDKLRQLASPLIEQIAVCVRSNYTEGRPLLQECLNALVDSVTDDSLLKSINLNILMHTRSDDVRLQILALTCSENLWRSHGGKLLGLLSSCLFPFWLM